MTMLSPRSLITLPFLLTALCGALEAQSSAEFLAVAARYGQINTIAGNGLTDTCSDWLPANEGGPATSADLSRPHIARADAEGNVYIADKEAYAIRRVDLAGVITTVAGTGTFGVPSSSGPATQRNIWGPNGLYLLPDGSFYFLTVNDNCDTGIVLPGGRVHKVTPDGTLTTVFFDSALTIGRGLYVSSDQSTIYYSSGTTFKKWTAAGGVTTVATGFTELGYIAVEPAGSILVTDRGGHRVWRVQPNGTKTVVAGTGGTTGGGHGQLATSTGLNQVRGVALLDTGGYFLCTHRGSQVWYVDKAGYIWLFIDGSDNDSTHAGDGLPISTPGLKISEPRDITIAPNGDLLIAENDRGFVRRVTNITTKPRLTSITYDSSASLRLEWTSHREGRYVVRHSTNLLDWSSSAPIIAGNGSRTSYTDPVTTESQRMFYQVAEAP